MSQLAIIQLSRGGFTSEQVSPLETTIRGRRSCPPTTSEHTQRTHREARWFPRPMLAPKLLTIQRARPASSTCGSVCRGQSSH
eukprot:2581279-Pleurochrysis_carterae.AAC.5